MCIAFSPVLIESLKSAPYADSVCIDSKSPNSAALCTAPMPSTPYTAFLSTPDTISSLIHSVWLPSTAKTMAGLFSLTGSLALGSAPLSSSFSKCLSRPLEHTAHSIGVPCSDCRGERNKRIIIWNFIYSRMKEIKHRVCYYFISCFQSNKRVIKVMQPLPHYTRSRSLYYCLFVCNMWSLLTWMP